MSDLKKKYYDGFQIHKILNEELDSGKTIMRILSRFADKPSAQPEHIQNNSVHLCGSCQYTFPTCPTHDSDVIFGDGKGNDNICACNKYRPISAQPERDIPMKPNETIDSSWGIQKKQAVCPKCDYYLGRVEFIGNPNGKKVTYCETCGQAIDWEGWEWDE